MNRCLAGLGGFACLLAAMPLAADGPEPVQTTALQSSDWMDLTPGKELQGWKRVPISPDKSLNKRNPWKMKDGILQCTGKDLREMLLYKQPFGDGTLHVEWRFHKVTNGKTDYNSGIYVRSRDDGKVWHQIQVAHSPKPPRLGDIFGDILVKGEVKRVLQEGTGPQHAHPPGEWNSYDIVCKGKQISVWVNGTKTCVWNNCDIAAGYLGLQAEFYNLDFRNIRFKKQP